MKAYFFNGGLYVRYDSETDRVDEGFPLPIDGNWPGFGDAGFDTGIDGAVNWGNGKAYFFRRDRYLRYDIAADRADDGFPLPIAGNWPGFEGTGFDGGVDDGVNWGNGKAYFFRGDRYLRYDVATDTVDDGFPLPTAGSWAGFAEAGFATGIDAAVNWGNGKAYFFRGDEYLRYDIAGDAVDDGYPLPVAGNWPGLAEAGVAAPDAAVAWSAGPLDGGGPT